MGEVFWQNLKQCHIGSFPASVSYIISSYHQICYGANPPELSSALHNVRNTIIVIKLLGYTVKVKNVKNRLTPQLLLCSFLPRRDVQAE